MPCYLLHILEQPDPDPYSDPNLKDLVGAFPKCYCTQCTPPQALSASETVHCLNRESPCWKPADTICE